MLNCILSATGLQGMLPHSQQYHLLPPIIRVTIYRDVPINYGNIFISGTGREGSSDNASILYSGGSGFEFRAPQPTIRRLLWFFTVKHAFCAM